MNMGAYAVYGVPCLGAVLFGVLSGIVGVIVLVRKQGLLADTVAHAAYPGIMVSYLIWGHAHAWMLVCGGCVTSVIGVMSTILLMRARGMRYDAALGTVLSIFFSSGIFMLSLIQKAGMPQQSLLHTFFLGNMVTLLHADLYNIMIVGLVVCVFMAFCGKMLLVGSFDAQYAVTIGVPIGIINTFFIGLLIAVILVGLQAVGVILMSALLIAPAAAARQWSSHVPTIMQIAALLGGSIALVSYAFMMWFPALPTGPLLVMCGTFCAFYSLFFAPHRGIVWQ